MTPHSLARVYANALFDVAQKNGQLERVRRDLAAFAALLSEHDELRRLFSTPAVPRQRKKDIADALLAPWSEMTAEVRRLVWLMAEHDRLALIPDVEAAFILRSFEADRVVRAELTTAVPMGDESKAALVGALSKAVGRTIIATERVDPAIMGGVVAKVGGVVFDGSIARRIERLRRSLLADAQA